MKIEVTRLLNLFVQEIIKLTPKWAQASLFFGPKTRIQLGNARLRLLKCNFMLFFWYTVIYNYPAPFGLCPHTSRSKTTNSHRFYKILTPVCMEKSAFSTGHFLCFISVLNYIGLLFKYAVIIVENFAKRKSVQKKC